MNRTAALVLPVVLAAALGLTACSPAAPSAPAPGGDNGSTHGATHEDETTDDEGTDASGAVDADGYVIPGEVVQLQLGDSVSYYSMPKLTLDDAQKVTIHDVEYLERATLPAGAELDKIDEGVVLIHLTWETLKGSVQSSTTYVRAQLESSDTHGSELFFREDRLRNGKVSPTEPESGTYAIAVNRGPTIITIFDYANVPVAELRIDTSDL